VIAALISVPLDDLRKRDAIADRNRIWMVASAAAVFALLMLATGYLVIDRWTQQHHMAQVLERIGQLAPEQRASELQQLRDEAKTAGRQQDAEFFDELAKASQTQIRAVELVEEGKLDEAVKELDRADMVLDRLPIASAWVRIQRAFNYKTFAQAYLEKGDVGEGGRYLDRTRNIFEQVRNDPNVSPRERASAIHGIGNVESLRGDERAAIARYDEAGKIDPANGYVWYDRFISYMNLAQKGDVDLAAMKESVARARDASSLTRRDIAALEAELRKWETACANRTKAC
jgi:tetratricopeptide (TPR) repeat protein